MNYEQHKKDMRERMRAQTAQGQDIAPLPQVENIERRERAFKSFKFFCETYFKSVFYLKWSDIHLKVIEKIERVIVNGEIFALAMPRGSGKTSLFQIAVLWAALTGRSQFIVLISANANRANSLLEDMKIWLETNDELEADFPEVCYPIRKLERIAQRQRGQTLNGEPTRIGFRANELILPTVPGSVASGCCIKTAGTKGSDLRGLSRTRTDGEKVRPSLVLVDDPQTRESAYSLTQCDNLEKILKADVLGMAGPGKKIACCIAMTVVARDDVAERLLDRSKNPEFRGERYKLLAHNPDNLALWTEYDEIRKAELKNDGDGSQATAFYKARRAEMDAGAIANWEERYNVDEISAIQHAMNLRLRDETAFFSEYQNEPKQEDSRVDIISSSVVLESGKKLGVISQEAQFLTGFIDVHKNLLYWTLCAFDSQFNGAVVNYGVYPKQRRKTFKLNDASPTLVDINKGAGLESAIYGGLQELTNEIFSKEYTRDDGVIIEVERLLIDANWGESTDVIYRFIKDSPYRSKIYPSHGQYIGARNKPFGDIAIKRGDRIGLHWRIPNDAGRNGIKRVLIDTNYWKSFLMARLTTSPGDKGRLSVNGTSVDNALLLQHLTAEKRIEIEANGRRVDEWRNIPDRDNHWLDCLTGSLVAASINGASLSAIGQTWQRQKKTISFAELQKKAKSKR